MKKYANEYGHSDIHPCRVVNTISSKTLEVQRMGSKLADDWKPDTKSGGFFGHTINNDSQRWEMKPDLEQPVFRIRWSNAKNRWQDEYGTRYILENMPKRFHDYNF